MATTNARYIVGLFDDRSDADSVVKELKDAGFSGGDIHTDHHGDAGRGFVDKLTDHGVPDKHAHYYAEGVRRGGSLVRVESDDDHYQKALTIMKSHGAVDINKRASYYEKQGFQSHDEDAAHYSQDEVRADRERYDNEKGTLDVIEEEVHVGKEKVDTGGVRIFTRVTETPVEKDVNLREEHVDVERHKVDRPANAADIDSMKEGDITVRETAERAVVSKEARVTEEVEVNKRVDEHTEHISETERKRDVEVEKLDRDATRRNA